MSPSPKVTAVVVGVVLGLTGLSGCSTSGGSSQTGPTVTATVTATAPGKASPSATPVASTSPSVAQAVPNVVHYYLDSAHSALSAAGLSDSAIVESAVGENSVVIIEHNWIVLSQVPAAGTPMTSGTIVHLNVVKLTDPKASGITPKG